jgi:hypothetical protein
MSDNGSWSGMVELVINGTAHVGVGAFTVMKERSEIVAYTNTLNVGR